MADYHEMWKGLGMDLEKHDQLCEVLPTAFGDTYLTQENRPEAMDYFNFVVAEIHGVRPQELIAHQEKGGKVFGTFCVYVPDEIVFAADAIATGLCGGSQFWVPGGEKVLPANTCPLIKASVGARLDRTCPFFRIADMYVGETTCDGKKKAWEILSEDVPVHVMQLPQMKRAKDIQAWKEEIEIFLKKVEEFTGNAVTPEKLAQAYREIGRLKSAGLIFNAHIMTGIAGAGRGLENAEETAAFFNRTKPERITNFSLFLDQRTPLFREIQNGNFAPADELENLEEERRLLELLETDSLIYDGFHDFIEFRVKGVLPADREKMLHKLDAAIAREKTKGRLVAFV